MVFSGWVLIILFFVWLLAVTIWLYQTTQHYNRLTRGITPAGLTPVLQSLLRDMASQKKEQEEVRDSLRLLAQEGRVHIQKIGIVRFNPFSDTGGSQSFTIAILDHDDNGVVMTSLYGRSGNRWYVKEVKQGKGKVLELSKEETSAIRQSQHT